MNNLPDPSSLLGSLLPFLNGCYLVVSEDGVLELQEVFSLLAHHVDSLLSNSCHCFMASFLYKFELLTLFVRINRFKSFKLHFLQPLLVLALLPLNHFSHFTVVRIFSCEVGIDLLGNLLLLLLVGFDLVFDLGGSGHSVQYFDLETAASVRLNANVDERVLERLVVHDCLVRPGYLFI